MINWDSAITDRLLILRKEGLSESQIADKLSKEYNVFVTRDAVHNKLTRYNEAKDGLKKRQVVNIMPYYSKYIDMIEGDTEGPQKKIDYDGGTVFKLNKKNLKILYLGDLHIPFQIDEQVEEAVNENINADIVVTNEVMDCYAISRFRKSLSIPMETEIDRTVRYFEYLNSTFDLAIVFGGNHELRVHRKFQEGIPTPLMWMIKDNMLRLLAKPFPNVIVVDGLCVQINDCLFAHMESFSKVDLKSAVNAYNFFQEWKTTLNLDDFRCVVQGHTHMCGASYRAGNFKIIEGGCLCNVPDYAVEKMYSKPQTNGYVVVRQVDGVTDFNNTREFVFEGTSYVPYFNPIKLGGIENVENDFSDFLPSNEKQ